MGIFIVNYKVGIGGRKDSFYKKVVGVGTGVVVLGRKEIEVRKIKE